jgi:hypothetical protein
VVEEAGVPGENHQNWKATDKLNHLLDTTLCDKVCQSLAVGRLFSSDTPVSSTNKTYHHDITEILLKVVELPSAVHSYRVPGKFIRRLKSLFV